MKTVFSSLFLLIIGFIGLTTICPAQIADTTDCKFIKVAEFTTNTSDYHQHEKLGKDNYFNDYFMINPASKDSAKLYNYSLFIDDSFDNVKDITIEFYTVKQGQTADYEECQSFTEERGGTLLGLKGLLMAYEVMLLPSDHAFVIMLEKDSKALAYFERTPGGLSKGGWKVDIDNNASKNLFDNNYILVVLKL